jgi:hypothetical protein
MRHDVFISYASSDKIVADAICNALEQRAVRCWIAPRDVLPGNVWAEAIVAAISSCRAMVLIVSEATNRSAHIAREVERAADREVVIVPFRVSDAKLTGSLEYFLQSRHWLDAMTPPLEAHIGRLCEVVSRLLSPTDAERQVDVSPVTGARAWIDTRPHSVRKVARPAFKWALAVCSAIALFALYYALSPSTEMEVTIESNPPGAWIHVNGVQTGQKTPSPVKLKAGENHLTLQLDGIGHDALLMVKSDQIEVYAPPDPRGNGW